jgi:ferredoxin
MDDDGHGYVKTPAVDEDEREAVLRAVGNCPENAIRVRLTT